MSALYGSGPTIAVVPLTTTPTLLLAASTVLNSLPRRFLSIVGSTGGSFALIGSSTRASSTEGFPVGANGFTMQAPNIFTGNVWAIAVAGTAPTVSIFGA